MAWLHSAAERRMKRRRTQRQAIVRELQHRLKHQQPSAESARIAHTGFELADSEACVFQEWFGEPAPQQLRGALNAEANHWVQLVSKFDRLRSSSLSTAQSVHLLVILRKITALLTLESQILRSPLTVHFQRAVEAQQ
jgi:hypothetical protein